MKKSVAIALLLTLGCVLTSQAVVIGWAAENLPAGTGYARLVYVASGAPPALDGNGQWASGTEALGDLASGGAIDGTSLYPQSTTDATTRGAGAYYVVLFDSANENYSVSTTSITWNDGPSISAGAFDPITEYFTPNGFTEWGVVPEPSVAMLLAVGAAAAALRRRKNV